MIKKVISGIISNIECDLLRLRKYVQDGDKSSAILIIDSMLSKIRIISGVLDNIDLSDSSIFHIVKEYLSGDRCGTCRKTR